MPYVPFISIFVVLVVFVQIKLAKASHKRNEKIENYFVRDQNSNFISKKIIPDHIFIKPTIIDFSEFYCITDAENEPNKNKIIHATINKIEECTSMPMVRFDTEYTNIDLKELFGVSNLEALISYDQNYNNYIKYLNSLAKTLLELDQFKLCELILLEAIKQKSDVSLTYILLIDLYQKYDIKKLLEFTENFKNNDKFIANSFLYDKVIAHINKC